MGFLNSSVTLRTINIIFCPVDGSKTLGRLGNVPEITLTNLTRISVILKSICVLNASCCPRSRFGYELNNYLGDEFTFESKHKPKLIVFIICMYGERIIVLTYYINSSVSLLDQEYETRLMCTTKSEHINLINTYQ